MNKGKDRRITWRSYRRLNTVLFAFAAVGFAMGILLLGAYAHRRQGVLLWLGATYVILAAMLFGIRGILEHLDDLHRRRRFGHGEKG